MTKGTVRWFNNQKGSLIDGHDALTMDVPAKLVASGFRGRCIGLRNQLF